MDMIHKCIGCLQIIKWSLCFLKVIFAHTVKPCFICDDYRRTFVKVYQSIDEFTRIPFAVATIGTFDGVHAGHQKIISRLTELAQMNNGETVVLTFFPHPRMVLQPDDNTLKMITT